MSDSYGIPHVPLIARVQANRKNPDKVVAFIGEQICFFERDTYTPPADENVEVMITRVLLGVYPKGHKMEGCINRSAMRALMIEVVDPVRHMLVAIDGFSCDGTMCRTTAHGYGVDPSSSVTQGPGTGGYFKEINAPYMWLTPGRTGIKEAFNVNVRSDQSNRQPRTPTNVWVEKSRYDEVSGAGVRIHGLTRIEDGQWSHLVQRIRPMTEAIPDQSRSDKRDEEICNFNTEVMPDRYYPGGVDYVPGDVVSHKPRAEPTGPKPVAQLIAERDVSRKTGSLGELLQTVLKSD